MNMLMREDMTVNFNATLFHLCRTSSLQIYCEDNNLRKNDVALRKLLKRLWPNITQYTINAVLPKKRKEAGKRTVGRLFAAKLIYENFKHMKKMAASVKEKKKDVRVPSRRAKRRGALGSSEDPNAPKKGGTPQKSPRGKNNLGVENEDDWV
jgi:hypothetical protein